MAAGYGLDALLGDPRRRHPVAGFGRFAGYLERQCYADSRTRGGVYAAAATGAPVLLAWLAQCATRRRPAWRATVVAAVTWSVLGGRSLRREGTAMAGELARSDLRAARQRLPSLCGREPSGLDTAGLARATVESIAENSSDAEVAPLCWGALAGLPGLIGYRAINTLDALVGHKSPRYARFGTAAARLDDAVNLLPSRATALLTAATAPLAGGSARRALQVWRVDGDRHPSPNAGQCEAAFAGALGVRLGGENVYAGRAERRPVLGSSGRPPAVADVGRAVRLSAAVGAAAMVLAVGWRGSFASRRRRG